MKRRGSIKWGALALAAAMLSTGAVAETETVEPLGHEAAPAADDPPRVLYAVYSANIAVER